MGAGFLGLLAGGFIGYHWATHHGSEAKCAGWTNQEGRPHGWGRRWQQQQPLPVAEGNYPTQAPTSTGNGAPIPSGIEPHEFALFQQWKQQQQQQLSQQPRSPFPALQQPPNYDAMKAGAVESADRALDAILSQVQGMKEKLAQHRTNVERSVPTTPKTESGDFKLV